MQTEGTLLKCVLILLWFMHGDRAYSFSIKVPRPDFGISACVYCYARESEKDCHHIYSLKTDFYFNQYTLSTVGVRKVSLDVYESRVKEMHTHYITFQGHICVLRITEMLLKFPLFTNSDL